MSTTVLGKRKGREAELEKELLSCAILGRFDRLRELVELYRVNINCQDDSGTTPLMQAACFGYIQLVRYLLQKGANVNAANKIGKTALGYAILVGNVELAEILLENDANVETVCYPSTSSYAYSPLAQAICFLQNSAAMVALLLRFGANTEVPLFQNETNYPAIHIACRWRGIAPSVETVQQLLDHNDGVDVNTIAPRSGDTPVMSPLCHACQSGRMELAQLLIQHGARVVYDGVYPDAPCPLQHAVENGSLDLLRFLLDNSRFSSATENAMLPQVGGDMHPLSSPLDAAIRNNKLDAAKLLVERGANVNDQPLLYKSAARGDLNGARFLLRVGANVNLVNNVESGKTPLWIAARKGNAALVKELLKGKADVNFRDNGGETPLGVAYRRGHTGIVYLLLRTSPHVWSQLERVVF